MILHSEQLDALADALAKAQAEIKNPEKRRTAKVESQRTGKAYSYNYTDIADGLVGILPILSKHGISVVQPTSMEDGVIMLHTRLMHSSGQWIEGVYPVCPPGQHQDMGSAMTYSRRYALFSMVGVAGEDDVDGVNAATSAAPQKSAYQARKDGMYPILEQEIRGISSLSDLKTWWTERQSDIQALPPKWIVLLEEEKDRRKLALADEVTADVAKETPDHTTQLMTEGRHVGSQTETPGYMQMMSDPDRYLNDLDSQMTVCETNADLSDVWMEHEAMKDMLLPPDRAKAKAIFERHDKRLRATMAVDAKSKK